MNNRDKFVYGNGYGITTDIWLLEPNTTFEVINGYWNGKIIVENGKKFLVVSDAIEQHEKGKYEINEFVDYSLVIRKYKEEVKEEKTNSFPF